MTKEIEIPLVKATNENLKGYGYLIDSFENSDIEIVTWPKQGWRDIEEGTGNEGGTTEGSFDTWWQGDVLYGQNNAVQHKSDYEVDGKYILGYANNPDQELQKDKYSDPTKIFLWHANYHPDGGQLFFPEENKPFICPLAYQQTTLNQNISKHFIVTDQKVCIFIQIFGMKGCFQLQKNNLFKENKVKYMQELAST